MVEVAQTRTYKYDTGITRVSNRIAGRRSKRIASVAAAGKILLCRYLMLKNDHTMIRPKHEVVAVVVVIGILVAVKKRKPVRNRKH
jgi:preprotein translocase subunit Sec61beta